jgi:hypothetical protein
MTLPHFPPAISPSHEKKEGYACKQQGPQRRTNPDAYCCAGADPVTATICIVFRVCC